MNQLQREGFVVIQLYSMSHGELLFLVLAVLVSAKLGWRHRVLSVCIAAQVLSLSSTAVCSCSPTWTGQAQFSLPELHCFYRTCWRCSQRYRKAPAHFKTFVVPYSPFFLLSINVRFGASQILVLQSFPERQKGLQTCFLRKCFPWKLADRSSSFFAY